MQRVYNKNRTGCSLLLTVNDEKVVGYKIQRKAINGEDFLDFIKTHHVDNYVYLIDNARIHHYHKFKKYIIHPLQNLFTQFKIPILLLNRINMT